MVALTLLFNKIIKLKYLSVYFTFENHSNIKSLFVTFCLRIKMFLFYGNLHQFSDTFQTKCL